MGKLQGADHNKKGRGLEYLYLNVHDEDRDGELSSHLLLHVYPLICSSILVLLSSYLTPTVHLLILSLLL